MNWPTDSVCLDGHRLNRNDGHEKSCQAWLTSIAEMPIHTTGYSDTGLDPRVLRQHCLPGQHGA